MKIIQDASQFGYTVADIHRLLRRVFDRRAAHLGLTRAQWLALSRIACNEGQTQTELANELDMETIAVGRVVDRLEDAGFIERRADPADRRCWRLYRTAKSDEVMQEMKRLAAVLSGEFLQGVDPQELQTTLRVLAQVRQTIHQIDSDSKPCSRKDTRNKK